MSDKKTLTIPVAIVGGGPIGLMLALFLDRHGVKSVVFNIEDGTRMHPKGSTQNARTMEHYRRLGISAEVREVGLPRDHTSDVAYFTRLNAWEMARLQMPSTAEKMRRVAASAMTDQVPEPLHRANQMYVERFLLQLARSRPNIVMRFGWQVTRFSEDASGISLQAERCSGGEEEHWRCQYAVGCDGGQSFVRRQLSIRHRGHDTLNQGFWGGGMMATYVRVPSIYRDFVGARRAFHYSIINPELRLLLVTLDGTGEFLLFNRADAAETVRLVQRAVGAEIPVEVLGQSPWTAGVALVAESFASDRTFLAGDAAHLFTPTGGFGMNTGIDDAANLAWKLAATLQGWGGPGLLKSYETERRPVAVRNTTAARQLAKSVGDIEVPPDLEDDAPAGSESRRRLGGLLSTWGEEYASLGVQLGARYDDSPLIVPDGPPPSDNYIEYVPSSAPGGRAPHLWVDEGRAAGSSLFDHLGIGFTLLLLGDKVFDSSGFEAAARRRGVPLKTLRVEHRDAHLLYDCTAALIRPDQHVAWRGNGVPADIDRLIAQVVGGDPAHAAASVKSA